MLYENDRYNWKAGEAVLTDKDGRPVDMNKLNELDELDENEEEAKRA